MRESNFLELLLEYNKKLKPVDRVQLITDLLGGKDVCPTCGHETERPALITKEEVKVLLGSKDEV